MNKLTDYSNIEINTVKNHILGSDHRELSDEETLSLMNTATGASIVVRMRMLHLVDVVKGEIRTWLKRLN